MKFMLCMRGEPDQLPYLTEIAELGAGIELGSYGMIGIRSEQDWQSRHALHMAIRKQFQGALAIHGPFIGMEYSHVDHLLREAVHRRLDMTFDAAVNLKSGRVVLHSGYGVENDLFQRQEAWLARNIEFWKQEIHRWAEAGIVIVLENDTDRVPDLMVELVNAVDHPFLGLCLDIGHQHVFSELSAMEWLRRMGNRLWHVHLHDNDRTADKHWPLGHGTIDFEPFYTALLQHAPQATLSLEVEDSMEIKMSNLRALIAYFTSKEQPRGSGS